MDDLNRLKMVLGTVMDFPRPIESVAPHGLHTLRVNLVGGGYAVLTRKLLVELRHGVGRRYPTPEIIDEPDAPIIVGA